MTTEQDFLEEIDERAAELRVLIKKVIKEIG